MLQFVFSAFSSQSLLAVEVSTDVEGCSVHKLCVVEAWQFCSAHKLCAVKGRRFSTEIKLCTDSKAASIFSTSKLCEDVILKTIAACFFCEIFSVKICDINDQKTQFMEIFLKNRIQMSEPYRRRAMCFSLRELSIQHLESEYAIQRERPQKGDIVFTPDYVYVLSEQWEIVWGRKLDRSYVSNVNLDFYEDVIRFAEKHDLVFRMQVSIPDQKLVEYIGERPLLSWEFAVIVCKNGNLKVKISFAQSQPRWRYSRLFTKTNDRYRPHPGTLNFYQAFRLCLGQWKSLIAFCRLETSFVIAGRRLGFTRKFGKEFDLGTRKLTFNHYHHAYLWFYPTWYINFLREMAVTAKEQVADVEEFEPNRCVIINDNEEVATLTKYDYHMERTRDKFYWDEVINIYLGLESLQLPNYVLFEIISWIPYMQDISRNFAMKIILKMFESVCKVRAQRANKRKK